MSDKAPLTARAARWTRFALLAVIAVVIALFVTTPRNELPLTMSRAQANSISAAPGYLMTSLAATTADRFFLVDTTKQVMCVYSVTGDQLRLIAARKIDSDADIVDGSVPMKIGKLEGGNGLSRDQAKTYWEELKAKIEEMEKKGKVKP